MASKQKVIIKVGRYQILLPDDTGAATVVKALSRGMVVWHFGGNEVQIRDEEMEVSLSYLPKGIKYKTEDGHDAEEPVEKKYRKREPLRLKPPAYPQLMPPKERRLF